jgi:hypothetical protein
MTRTWEERLAEFQDEFTRKLPNEACARFAAAVVDYLKGQVRGSFGSPEEAFDAALQRLVDFMAERTFNKAFCARMRALREAAGLSQAEVARELGFAPDEYSDHEVVDMPEGPVVVTLFRFEWESLERLARKGEAWAADQIAHLWDAFKDQRLPCFLCEIAIEDRWPPYTQIVGTIRNFVRR